MKNNLSIGSAPFWAWALVGWLALGALAKFWERGSLGRAVGNSQEIVEANGVDWDLNTMSQRELRTVPSIGPKRAVDLVEQRWTRAPPGAGPTGATFDPRSIPGIGERTARGAEHFIKGRQRAHRTMPDPGILPPPLMQ